MKAFAVRALAIVMVCSLLAGLLALSGCATSQRGDLASARRAYGQGNYIVAQRDAAAVAQSAGSARSQARYEAAYLAGLSAFRLGDHRGAIHWLQIATKSGDEQLVGDALAQQGIVLAAQGRDVDAQRMFLAAAPRMKGEDRGRAYYQAAQAQQRLGWTAQARRNFTLAASQTSDQSDFAQRTRQELATTGYTLQLGAFGNQANAQRLAREIDVKAQSFGLGTTRVARGDDNLYRVYVGRFANRTLADRARRSLGDAQARVVSLQGR